MAPDHVCGLYRAYSPGEYKLLSSTGGGNFEEIACWRTPSQKTASFVETVMLEGPVHVKELTIVMRDPMPWHYFGLNDISLLVEPYPFMIVNGASTMSKESCLVSSGTSLKLESCLSAIATGDGREVFEFTDDAQIVSSTTGRCITLVNGDIQDGGKIALEKCRRAEDAHDGHSAWSLTASGQLMLTSLGNYCLDTSGPSPAVQNCGAEVHHVSLVAVPKFDPNGSTQIKDTAALLMASVGRQSVLSAKLQDAMPLLDRCVVPASFMTNASVSLMKLGKTSATSVVPAAGAAMEAIAEIYPAMRVDMSSVKGVITHAAGILNTVHGKVAH